MREDQIDRAERRETLENDRKVREAEHQRLLCEGTTFHQHAQSAANDEAGGRFAAINPVTVVGSDPALKYPAASSSWQIQLPDEPPLGFENPALESAFASLSSAQTGGAADAPSAPPNVERAAPPPSSKGSDDGAA
jgi:hypothetical protein